MRNIRQNYCTIFSTSHIMPHGRIKWNGRVDAGARRQCNHHVSIKYVIACSTVSWRQAQIEREDNIDQLGCKHSCCPTVVPDYCRLQNHLPAPAQTKHEGKLRDTVDLMHHYSLMAICNRVTPTHQNVLLDPHCWPTAQQTCSW